MCDIWRINRGLKIKALDNEVVRKVGTGVEMYGANTQEYDTSKSI